MRAPASLRHRGMILPGLATSLGLLAIVATLLVQLLSAGDGGTSLFSSTGSRDWRIVGFTTFQAAVSTILSLTAGLALAWALSHQNRFPGRSVLIAIFSSALVLPTLVVVLGVVSVFGRNGWLNLASEELTGYEFGSFIYGLTGILVAHVYLNASYSVRTLLNRLESIPLEKRKLVRSLGITSWRRFLLIEWPAVRPALPRLATVIFLLCFTSFAIVLTLGGSPKYNTLEVAIFEAIKLDFDLARALDLALLQLIICAALVLVSGNLKSVDAQIARNTSNASWRESRLVTVIQATIIAIVGLFFLTPLIAVLIDGISADLGDIVGEKTFKKAFISSLIIASISSLMTLVAALSIASAYRNFVLPHRMGNMPLSQTISRVLTFSGTLFLAVPSLVMALGFFLLARELPGSLTFWGFVAIVFANTLMALPFALAILIPSMEKLAARYDRLVFSLDLSRITRWKLVEWPVLSRDLGYVCAVSFCLSFGDLGVVALFGSQDFATLPWYLYQKMGSYQTHDAAGIAMIMLVLTIAIFFIVPRIFAGASGTKGRNHVEA